MLESSARFLFLTGATGHTGSRFARRLLDDGWRLRCLNHNPEHAQYFPRHGNLEIVCGDVRQPAGWANSLRGSMACIHMAHIGFAPHVIAACAAAGVRRVICMSSTRRFTQFPERTARLVIEGETSLEASSLDYTILRASMIYGGDRDNNLEKVVRWFRRHRWFPLVRGGRNLVQPIFVGDMVDALARALNHPDSTRRRALTVAGPCAISYKEMIETIAHGMNRRPIWIRVPYSVMMAGAGAIEKMIPRPPITRDQIRRLLEDKAFDISDAQKALGGWRPREFSEGIALKLANQA